MGERAPARTTPGPQPRWWRLARTAAGTSSALALAAAVTLLVLHRSAVAPTSLWFPRGTNLPLAATLLAMGWLLAARRPTNPVSWAVLVAGCMGSFQSIVIEVAIWAHARGADAVGAWAALGVETLWPGIVFSLLYALGRFPGDRARRGHRALLAVAVTAVLTMSTTELLLAGPLQNVDWYDNPIEVIPRTAITIVEPVGYLPFMALIGLAVWLFATGFRRSRGVERQQFRWVAVMSTPFVVSMALLPLTIDPAGVSNLDPNVLASTIGMSLVPIGIAIAIIRHRLFELDRLLSRTVAWVLLTGLVVGLWATVALLPSALLGGDGSTDQLLVAGATVLAAAVFNPLRTRLQEFVDRRLHRERYDARREVERLGSRLADEVDPRTVARHVLATVERTLAPTTAAVWTPDLEARR